MKKIAFLLWLFPLLLTAQIQVNNNWKNLINPTFQNLDKSDGADLHSVRTS